MEKQVERATSSAVAAMHRRAVLRLSRRVDLPSTGYACSGPRTFRSSALQLNDANGDGSGASSPAPAPKFGNKWGSRQTSKPTALSAAEQALRQSLRSANQPPPDPEPPKQPDPANRTPISFYREDSESSDTRSTRRPAWSSPMRQRESGAAFRDRTPRDRPPRDRAPAGVETSGQQGREMRRADRNCPQCKRLIFAKYKTCPFCNPGQPSEASQIPYQLRRTDWGCTTCGKDNFGRNMSCFSCGTIRPEIEQLRQQQQQPPQQPQSQQQATRADPVDKAKFQELGRSILADSGEEPPGELREELRFAPDDPASKKNGKSPKDDWSWDMSALEKLEAAEVQNEQTASQKKSKRRDGRTQRQAESEEAEFDVDEHQRRRDERKRLKKAKAAEKAAAPAPLYLPEFISVSNLADVIGTRPAQFVQRMEEMGFEDVTYDHVLDAETAGLVAAEYNYEAIFDTGAEDLEAAPVPEDVSALPARPPVVTIMGHVDHGKTTILDWLRKSSVAATEHGGITQHIGAFSVAMPSGKMITFLDTPGHSAFLEMRRRGADVTDIVVLVVAADDSVKPQTIEAIKHATQAKVPIIVAMSKIDKEGRNPDRVKQDLSVHGVHVEDYGGDVQAIPVSGKTGEGMLDLEEAIGALSELLDHRAEVNCNAEGWVIEASTKSHGRVASALIRRGTLRPGDVVVAGTTWARVRTLRNEAGLTIQEATPGMPVEIDGWREQPAAGTEILQATSEQQAKDVVEYRLERVETQRLGEDMVAINQARRGVHERRRLEATDSDEAAAASEPSGPKRVNFIIKADVDGSAEAVVNSIAAIGNSEVYPNVLRSGVGPVAEFDIEHAASANGKVISFNMPIEPNMMRMAEEQGVAIMDHNIIYKLIDEVKETLSEHLAPTITQRVTGEAEVQQVFEITLKGRDKTAIAGCRVRNGLINRARKVRVTRGDETIYDGSITSLKNMKKDVTEMRKDTECGIGFEGWTAFAVGDHIQCYEEIREKRYL